MLSCPSVCQKSIFCFNEFPKQMYERLIIGEEKTLVFPPPMPPSLALFDANRIFRCLRAFENALLRKVCL